MLSHPFPRETTASRDTRFLDRASGHLIAMILRDPHELVSRRLALTMTDVVAMLVVFVAIVAILV